MNEMFNKLGRTEIRNIIAVLAVIGCFLLLYLMMIKEIPKENQNVINTAIGFVFGGLLSGVAGYYFGASKTEVDKEKTKETK